MNWTVEIKPSAEKQYLRLGKSARQRIKAAIRSLETSEHPLRHENVRALTGPLKGDYRLRVGDKRVLFTPNNESRILHVYAILPRDKAY